MSAIDQAQYGTIEIVPRSKLEHEAKQQPIPLIPPKPAVRLRASQQQKQVEEANDSLGNNNQFTESSIATIKPQEIQRELNKISQNLQSKSINSEITQFKDISTTLPIPQPDSNLINQRPYPKKVFFIVANEFCERFSYYGLRTVLVLYFKSVLGFSDSNSAISFHLFAALCFLSPIFGAILGESIWGKFKTILYLSILYFFGELLLVFSSIFWDTGVYSVIGTFAGLILIGIGTGGIKPCVCTLGGDQFLPHEQRWREGFFSVLYASINMGSLISMFSTPILRSNFKCVEREDCYPYAFGLPCILMFLSIIVFLMAKNTYHLTPLPEKNVITAFCQCVWLAMKRKLTGFKFPVANEIQKQSLRDNASSSSLSVSSVEDNTNYGSNEPITSKTVSKKTLSTNQHWLYLASDQFDKKSIEDFRNVLNIILILVPVPVYWCLFDQQGSQWTLQATRMDGRVFNTGYVLQPDQMSVANPILLLCSIPVFEVLIYPFFNKFKLLTSPLQKMTAGGFLAAFTFVISAFIELRIQQFMPPVEPISGQANLILVNGLSECSLINPTISYVNEYTNSSDNLNGGKLNQRLFNAIQPLAAQSIEIPSSESTEFITNYQIKFNLADEDSILNSTISAASKSVGCPFNPQMEHEISFDALKDKSVKLVYLEQGNGKLNYKLFNESLKLPGLGKARIRLIYESFGSSIDAKKREFFLIRDNPSKINNSTKLQFSPLLRDGQVSISDYLDVEVHAAGEYFFLETNDSHLNLLTKNSKDNRRILIEPGTRNLILAHQKNATFVQVNHHVLQDNKYRISMMYQLIPYLLISMSEVMFSITGLEFSYGMAPENMRIVVMSLFSLTVAFGNILTVAVKSMHLFSNVAHLFFFFAALLALDMCIFGVMAHFYKPYEGKDNTRSG